MRKEDEQRHCLTIIEKSVARKIRTLKWDDLLEYVRNRYPDAYIKPLQEIAFFQIGNQETVFRFDGYMEEEFLETRCLSRPFFTDAETQKHFASLNLCIGDKMMMEEMIQQCAEFVDEVNKNLPKPITKDEYIAQMKTYFPLLKRWRNNLQDSTM